MLDRRTALAGVVMGLIVAQPVLAQQVSPPSGAMHIGGVSFEPNAQVAGQSLRLNGVGLRAVAWFKGYAAALYLTDSARTAGDVLRLAGPKRLRLRMLVEVPTHEFVRAVQKGVERNTPAATQAALREPLAQFDRVLNEVDKVLAGDIVDLDLVPGQGLVIAVNGVQRGTAIAGQDFYAALMLVFVGDRPVDRQLKAGLLGKPPS